MSSQEEMDAAARAIIDENSYASPASPSSFPCRAEHGLGVFSRRSQDQGARDWTPEVVQPPARLRLYRATVVELRPQASPRDSATSS